MINFLNQLLWGDLFAIPLPGGGSIGISLLVLILIPAGLFFTVRTKFLPIRCFREMLHISVEKSSNKSGSLSGMQTLIVSTATRVGMGNLVGVVAAVSAGGAGAVFWMWVTALIGSSTAYIEATLAQLYKEPDPLYGGTRGGPTRYIHSFFHAASNSVGRSSPSCSPFLHFSPGAVLHRSSVIRSRMPSIRPLIFLPLSLL
jgi:AGCS family alanine or glycine:cation symporter